MTDTTLFIAGSLFTSDYLTHGITETASYAAVDTVALAARLTVIVDTFPAASQPNEAQTEDDLIWPVLAALGWTEALRQQNLTAAGREDVPDGLLFEDASANLNSLVFDYVARQKIQGQHLNWFIVEQLPVVPATAYARTFGSRPAAEIVRTDVLGLSYAAHDLAPFARDLGYVDADGAVLPPFAWDEERRLRLRARLDALFFILYGVTDRDDVRYIFSTFPIVEREEMARWGRYRSRDLTLAWINALNAGQPDVEIDG